MDSRHNLRHVCEYACYFTVTTSCCLSAGAGSQQMDALVTTKFCRSVSMPGNCRCLYSRSTHYGFYLDCQLGRNTQLSTFACLAVAASLVWTDVAKLGRRWVCRSSGKVQCDGNNGIVRSHALVVASVCLDQNHCMHLHGLCVGMVMAAAGAISFFIAVFLTAPIFCI